MSFDSIKPRPGALEDMGYHVGDVVEPAADNQHWEPQGLMIVVDVRQGKKTGMTVITAEDSIGKRFTGFDASFKWLSKGNSKI